MASGRKQFAPPELGEPCQNEMDMNAGFMREGNIRHVVWMGYTGEGYGTFRVTKIMPGKDEVGLVKVPPGTLRQCAQAKDQLRKKVNNTQWKKCVAAFENQAAITDPDGTNVNAAALACRLAEQEAKTEEVGDLALRAAAGAEAANEQAHKNSLAIAELQRQQQATQVSLVDNVASVVVDTV